MNKMIARSLEFGKKIKRNDREYTGRNPEYTQIKNPLTGIVDWVKVRSGLPYIRTHQGKQAD